MSAKIDAQPKPVLHHLVGDEFRAQATQLYQWAIKSGWVKPRADFEALFDTDNQTAKLLGLVQDGQLLAMAVVRQRSDDPAAVDLQTLASDPRHKGNCQALLALVIAETLHHYPQTQKIGARVVGKTDQEPGNQAAMALFHKAGFKEVDMAWDDPDGRPRVIFEYAYPAPHQG